MTDVPCPWKVYNAAVGTALEIKIYAALWERVHEGTAERGRGVFRRIWRSQAGRGGRHPEELGAALRRRVYPCSSGDPHASTLRKLSKRRSEGWTPFPRERSRASAQSARKLRCHHRPGRSRGRTGPSQGRGVLLRTAGRTPLTAAGVDLETTGTAGVLPGCGVHLVHARARPGATGSLVTRRLETTRTRERLKSGTRPRLLRSLGQRCSGSSAGRPCGRSLVTDGPPPGAGEALPAPWKGLRTTVSYFPPCLTDGECDRLAGSCALLPGGNVF